MILSKALGGGPSRTGEDMSEQVEVGRVPFFANGPVETTTSVDRDWGGHDWPLAAAIFGGAIAGYAVVFAAIYLALTALL